MPAHTNRAGLLSAAAAVPAEPTSPAEPPLRLAPSAPALLGAPVAGLPIELSLPLSGVPSLTGVLPEAHLAVSWRSLDVPAAAATEPVELPFTLQRADLRVAVVPPVNPGRYELSVNLLDATGAPLEALEGPVPSLEVSVVAPATTGRS